MDYSAIDNDLNQTDYKTWLSQSDEYKRTLKWAKVFVVVIGIIVVLVALSAQSAAGALWAIILSIVMYGVYILIKILAGNSVKNEYIFQQFADANNLTYSNGKMETYTQSTDMSLIATLHNLIASHHPKGAADAVLEGAIFKAGHSKTRNHILHNDNFTAFSYQYTTGSGKNARIHYWSVGVAKLPRRLPHILLDSISNNSVSFGVLKASNLPLSIDKSQKIDAGPLSEHYDIYVPDTYDIDVLSFITPEVVEVLISHSKDLDIEVIDDNVIVFTKNKFTPQMIQKILNPLLAVSHEITDNLKSYRDQRATTISQRDEIAQPGLRLQKSLWGGVTTTIFVVTYLAVRILEVDSSGKGSLVVVVIGSSVALFVLAKTLQKRKQRQEKRDQLRKQNK